MNNYLKNIEYLVSNDNLNHRFDQYVNLNNHCKSSTDTNLEFLVFESEHAFDCFQKKFYEVGSNLKNKYYFIAMIGTVMNLYFGLIIPVEKHREIEGYYPMFLNKFQQINYHFN